MRYLTGLMILALTVLSGVARAGDLEEAVAAVAAGQWGEAESCYSRHLAAQPTDAAALYSRGSCRLRLGREAEAIDDFRAVLTLKPTSTAAAERLATTLERIGHRAKARDAYRTWLQLAPNDAQAQAGWSRCPADPVRPAAPLAPTSTSPPRSPRLADADDIGPRVAVNVEGLDDQNLSAAHQQVAEVDASHLLDYTFGAAPTDWLPTGGRWQVVSRFACDPTWSFFGGYSEGLCSIWNKRRFTGDLVVEAYVSFMHGLPFNGREWSYRPADLCLTLDGDGHSLASGYSFIYSGDESSRTLIRRGDTVLGSTRDEEMLAPSYNDVKPDNENFHRRWWWLEAHLRGNRLQFYVDGRLAVDAVDPQPLQGGQVALWTQRNGMMVARVRVAYEGETLVSQPQVRVVGEPPLPHQVALATR